MIIFIWSFSIKSDLLILLHENWEIIVDLLEINHFFSRLALSCLHGGSLEITLTLISLENPVYSLEFNQFKFLNLFYSIVEICSRITVCNLKLNVPWARAGRQTAISHNSFFLPYHILAFLSSGSPEPQPFDVLHVTLFKSSGNYCVFKCCGLEGL